MTDTITLTGLVATVPYVVDQDDKVPFLSFRLASSQRYFDRRTSQWVAGDTNWYTVTAFRALAIHAAASVHKGDRVLVTGRLKIRRWEAGEKNGLSVDVEADSIGHDLVWGTARFERAAQRDASPAPDVPVTPSTDADTTVPGGAPAATPATQEAWDVTTPGRQIDDLVGASADVADTPF
ncbi:single-stranded DNA-binding protein [Mycetocola sp.]|uniref:single-stranded DNA-binding protein n=1 Tax=Mycetocola sp. TaxID=1871042 RepID=UPI00398A265B